MIILPSIVLLGIFVHGFIAQTMRVSVTDCTGSSHVAQARNPSCGISQLPGAFRFLPGRTLQTCSSSLALRGPLLLVGLLLATLIDQLVWKRFPTVFLYRCLFHSWSREQSGDGCFSREGINVLPTWRDRLQASSGCQAASRASPSTGPTSSLHLPCSPIVLALSSATGARARRKTAAS